MPPLSPEKPALCAGCGGKISDRYYLLAVDKQWHLRCLKCCECKLALESELTCFAKDGSIYCKEDYYRYSTPGRGGREGIPVSFEGGGRWDNISWVMVNKNNLKKPSLPNGKPPLRSQNFEAHGQFLSWG